jgi:hypothetical protein
LAVQIAVIRRIVANAGGGFAANGLRYFAFRAHPKKASHADSYPDIGWRFCQSSREAALALGSQAIQWFALKLACKDVS